MKIALMFPGQGSQTLGMGRDFFDNFSVSRHTFEEADDVLSPLYGETLSKIIFNGPEASLHQTLYTQSAIMTVSLAIVRALESQLGKSLVEYASFLAGHSLGEYSALCTGHALSLQDTASLLYYRGKSMQESVPLGQGAMAAILGLDVQKIETLIMESTVKNDVYIANDNGNQQIVISGYKEGVETIMAQCIENGAKRSIPLNVSAPFHSPLMTNAANTMQEKIQPVHFCDTAIDIVTNVDASPHQKAHDFKNNLVNQICGRVRWRETMEFFERENVTHFIEIGPGKVLTNIAKRMIPNAQSLSVSSVSDVDTFLTFFH